VNLKVLAPKVNQNLGALIISISTTYRTNKKLETQSIKQGVLSIPAILIK